MLQTQDLMLEDALGVKVMRIWGASSIQQNWIKQQENICSRSSLQIFPGDIGATSRTTIRNWACPLESHAQSPFESLAYGFFAMFSHLRHLVLIFSLAQYHLKWSMGFGMGYALLFVFVVWALWPCNGSPTLLVVSKGGLGARSEILRPIMGIRISWSSLGLLFPCLVRICPLIINKGLLM